MPSVIVLSHEEQTERLRAALPDAADIAVVAGDPCFDRILASRPLRAAYRAAFELEPDQKLVLVSSTWHADALLGQGLEIIAELAHRLPLDEYRMVVALHPNIWAGHSRWQVEQWLARLDRAGVALLPPAEGWRAALVAADAVIGDHGSVTFYGAALGLPVLLAAAPEHAVDPASPVGRLLVAAPRLTPSTDPVAALARELRTHRPDRYADITRFTTAVPGRAAELLRRSIYHQLELAEPERPAETRLLPAISTPRPLVGAQLVGVTLTDTEPVTATVLRYPADQLGAGGPQPAGAHLVVDTDQPTQRWLELAEILVHRGAGEPALIIADLLRRLPGCLLATAPEAPDRWLVGDRQGNRVQCTDIPAAVGPAGASALYGWLASGRPLASLPRRFALRVGGRRLVVRTELVQ